MISFAVEREISDHWFCPDVELFLLRTALLGTRQLATLEHRAVHAFFADVIVPQTETVEYLITLSPVLFRSSSQRRSTNSKDSEEMRFFPGDPITNPHKKMDAFHVVAGCQLVDQAGSSGFIPCGTVLTWDMVVFTRESDIESIPQDDCLGAIYVMVRRELCAVVDRADGQKVELQAWHRPVRLFTRGEMSLRCTEPRL